MITEYLVTLRTRIEDSTPLCKAVAGFSPEFSESLMLKCIHQQINKNVEVDENEVPPFESVFQRESDASSLTYASNLSGFKKDIKEKDNSKTKNLSLVLNEKDQFGLLPLHWAVLSNNLAAVKMLLSFKELDVNMYTSSSDVYINDSVILKATPLMLATVEGFDKIVSILVKNRSVVKNINLEGSIDASSCKYTALMISIRLSRFKCAKILLSTTNCLPKNGPKLFNFLAHAFVTRGDTIPSQNEKLARKEIAILLYEKCPRLYPTDSLNAIKANEVTVLKRCVDFNEFDFLETLLKLDQRGVNCGRDSKSSLHHCASQSFTHKPRESRTKCAEILIKYGAEIDFQTKHTYYTPLLTALHASKISSHAEEIAVFLMENGADKTSRSRQNFTPFCLAVFSNAVKAVKLLLNDKVNPNERFPWGVHPFWYACERFVSAPSRVEHDLAMLDVLLDHGSYMEQIDLINDKSNDKLRLAQHRKMDYITYLLGYSTTNNAASNSKKNRLCKKLIRLGIDLDYVHNYSLENELDLSKRQKVLRLDKLQKKIGCNVYDSVFLCTFLSRLSMLRLIAANLQSENFSTRRIYRANCCEVRYVIDSVVHRFQSISFSSLTLYRRHQFHNFCNGCCDKVRSNDTVLTCSTPLSTCSLFVCEKCFYYQSHGNESFLELTLRNKSPGIVDIARMYNNEVVLSLKQSEDINDTFDYCLQPLFDILHAAKIDSKRLCRNINTKILNKLGIDEEQKCVAICEAFLENS